MFAFPKLRALKQYLDSLNGKVDLPLLGQLLTECEISVDDVASACIFHSDHYSRNKIASSDWYDLLVLCWRPGQASAIHDHANSSCGFKILRGVASEVVFNATNKEDQSVVPVSTRDYDAGTICLAQDRDIHRISNESPTSDLVTLHCYSPPLHMTSYSLDPSLHLAESSRVSDLAAHIDKKS